MQQPAWPRVPRVLAMAKSAPPSAASGSGSLVYRRAPHTPTPPSSGSSLAGSSSSLSAGVRGHGNAVTMERSEEERQKYPDRINLDRKGLHGIEMVTALQWVCRFSISIYVEGEDDG